MTTQLNEQPNPPVPPKPGHPSTIVGVGASSGVQEFVSAEGRYTLKEDVFLGGVEPIGMMNPVGTSVSLIFVKFKQSNAKSGILSNLSTSNKEGKDRSDSPNENQTQPITVIVEDDNDDTKSTFTEVNGTDSPTPGMVTRQTSSFSLKKASPFSSNDKSKDKEKEKEKEKDKDKDKDEDQGFSLFANSRRKKSKNNIAKTNSSLVTKIVAHQHLAKILASKHNDETYVFYNVGKSFIWSDLHNPTEALSQIQFTKAYPTCHDINALTRSGDHLDVIIGLSTGDIVYFDPLGNKYSRINKQGVINTSAVTSIKWIPGSETQIVASHQDGSIIKYDREKDDIIFTPSIPNENSMFFVSKHPKSNSKYNPLSHWQVATKAISSFAFSPDFQHIAAVGLDGGLRVIDFNHEILEDVYSSYFGGLTCVCWSPDGKYILSGGQDDLITIWSYQEQRIVARCQGHSSWVTGVAFDPWRCDEKNYRFGSVGEDTKLLLWDFSVSALPRIKSRRRGSQSAQSHHSATPGNKSQMKPSLHALSLRNQVVMLQPTMAEFLHNDPLNSVVFRENSIITTCRRGHIKVWNRPSLTVL